MARKAQTKKDKRIELLQDTLEHNVHAIASGSKKKTWSVHNIRTIKPINYPQKTMFESYFSGNNIIANGSAGSGKSYAALYLGLNDVLSKEAKQNKLIIIRSIVSTRDIGYLPGNIYEKLEPYELPYKDMVGNLLNHNSAYSDMKSTGLIQFMPTSFIRGLTWDNAVIIVDEVQNMNFHEINSIITRVGEGSKIIVVGDYIQSDLIYRKNDSSGMKQFIDVAKRSKCFDEIVFTKNDIIRSGFVKAWICALEDSEF